MNDACDLLKKARYDLKLFEERASSYDLFNLIVDLTHICDWIENDKRFESDKHLESIKRRAKHLSYKDKEGVLVRQLCNKAKHFKKNPSTEHRSAGQSAAQLGMVQRVPASFSVTVDGEKVDVLKLCQSVLKKWETMLEQPESRYATNMITSSSTLSNVVGTTIFWRRTLPASRRGVP